MSLIVSLSKNMATHFVTDKSFIISCFFFAVQGASELHPYGKFVNLNSEKPKNKKDPPTH